METRWAWSKCFPSSWKAVLSASSLLTNVAWLSFPFWELGLNNHQANTIHIISCLIFRNTFSILRVKYFREDWKIWTISEYFDFIAWNIKMLSCYVIPLFGAVSFTVFVSRYRHRNPLSLRNEPILHIRTQNFCLVAIMCVLFV